MTKFKIEDHKLPRAVRLAFARLEDEKKRLEVELEWARMQMKSQEETIASLRKSVESTGNLVPIAYRHALKRAAEAAATPELAEKIVNINCPYR